MNKKKLLLFSLLFVNQKIKLINAKGPTSFLDNKLEGINDKEGSEVEPNMVDNNESNREQETQFNIEFQEDLKKNLTEEEILLLKNNNLNDLLVNINNKKLPKEKEILEKLNILKLFNFSNIKEIEYFVNPIFFINPDQLSNLKFADFKENITNAFALNQINDLSESLMNDIISCGEEYQKAILSSYDKSNKGDYKFFDYSTVSKLKKMNKIEELDVFRLGTTFKLNFNNAEPMVLDNTIFKNEEKKILESTDISKGWRNLIFSKKKIIKNKNINMDNYFKASSNIDKLALNLYRYERFLNENSFDATNFLKFLKSEEIKEAKELKLYNNIEDISLNKAFKDSQVGFSMAKDAHNMFIQILLSSGNKIENINKQHPMGVLSLSELREKAKNYNLLKKFNFKNLEVLLYRFMIGDEKNKINGTEYNNFLKKNSCKLPAYMGKIDEQLLYIHRKLYNPDFIELKSNKLEVNTKYANMMAPLIQQYNEIQNVMFQNNIDSPLAKNLQILNYYYDILPEEGYIINSVKSNKCVPIMLAEITRDIGQKLIFDNIKEKKVTINEKIKEIKASNIKILIPDFNQYEGDISFEFGVESNFGINGKGASGKTQWVMSLFTEAMLATYFGYTAAAKVDINESYKNNPEQRLFFILKNTGDTEISSKMYKQLSNKYSNEYEGMEIERRKSGSQTNYLTILRLAQFVIDANKKKDKDASDIKVTALLDETTSTVGPDSVKCIVTDIPEVKQAIAEGKMEILVIDHNSSSRRVLTSQELTLNFKLASMNKDINLPAINDNLFKKELIDREKNEKAYDHILESKFFGSNSNEINSKTFYFEINEKDQSLKLINLANYNRIKSNFPGKVTSYTYIPRLNNINNEEDKTGNITLNYYDQLLSFDPQAFSFIIGQSNKKCLAIIKIIPNIQEDKSKDVVIDYNIPNKIYFYDETSLIKMNDTITIKSVSEAKQDYSLIENKQPEMLRVIGQLTVEEMRKIISGYYEDELKKNERKNYF